MVSAMAAGELMRLLLEQMYLKSPAWAAESSPLCALELRERCRDRPLLHQFGDQYLKVLGMDVNSVLYY